jgi:crossover junction endodeoxyribonuclease RusA
VTEHAKSRSEVLLWWSMMDSTSKKLNLTVPFPPSVNTYWGFRGANRFLTKKAVGFKALVRHEYAMTKHTGFALQRLKVHIELNPPDRRVRDLDNYAKSLLDALCQAGIFVDDEQIDHLTLVRGGLVKGGQCLVRIEPLDCQQGITQA